MDVNEITDSTIDNQETAPEASDVDNALQGVPTDDVQDTPDMADSGSATTDEDNKLGTLDQTTDENQPDATPDYLSSAAAKFGDLSDPGNLAKMADAYAQLEGKLGTMGSEVSETRQLRDQVSEYQMREQETERNASAERGETESPEEQYWNDWNKNPLSNSPDPLLDQGKYNEWLTDKFMPAFQYKPVETMQHFMAPQLKQMWDGMIAELDRRDSTQKFNENFKSQWNGKAEWSGNQTVGELFSSWGQEGEAEYKNELASGMPHDKVMELMALRRKISPLATQAAATQAREAEVTALASGGSSRGATRENSDSLVGDGDSIAEMVHNSYKKQGISTPEPDSVVLK